MRYESNTPWNLEARIPPRFEPMVNNGHRLDPFVDLVDDWRESWAFRFTVTNATVETHSLRQIFGAFRVDQLFIAQSGVDGLNVHTYLSDEDSDADPSAALTLAQRVPRLTTGDLAAGTEGVSSSVGPAVILPGYVSRQGSARLAVVVINGAAAPVNIWGSITLVHLLPRCDCWPRY